MIRTLFSLNQLRQAGPDFLPADRPAKAGPAGRKLPGPARLVLCLAITASMLPLLIIRFSSVTHAEGGCPNEQLRSENHSTALPDCRAYEMVTPPFKFGEDPTTPVEAISTDGDGLYFTDLGAFGEPADSTGTGGPGYVASRGSAGWVSEPLEAPAAAFFRPAHGREQDVSDDLGATVLDAAPLSSKAIDQRFYLRKTGGALVQVGPAVPPAAVAAYSQANAEGNEHPEAEYVGASRDLSHLLFKSEREQIATDFLWSADETEQGSSLYEYVGTGHTGVEPDAPSLVGVNSKGQSISQCGDILASKGIGLESADTYNAISEGGGVPVPGVIPEEGAIVYFAANRGGCEGRDRAGDPVVGVGPNVNELFARINGSRTVGISEPSKEDCAACDTEEAEHSLEEAEAEALAPVFEGASKDGSKVFFLSRQKLLPGAAGVNLYEFDFRAPAADRVSLVANEMAEAEPGTGGPVFMGGVVRVSEDGSRVYFVSEDDGLATNVDVKGRTAVEARESGEGVDDLYVSDTETGATSFIGVLSEQDGIKDWKNEDLREAAATPDGRFLVFASVNDVTPDASGGSEQIYRYDAETGSLVRVTTSEGGYSGDGNAPALLTELAKPNYLGVAYAASPGVSVSDDGSKVVFSSSLKLTAGALDNVCVIGEGKGCEPAMNVYEWENGHVYLMSDGRDTQVTLGRSAVGFVGMTPSGSDIFFTSADPLVPSDTDTQADIYDARVDGGFPAPVTPAGCEGEACQGAPGASPPFGVPSSATLAGSGEAPSTSATTTAKVNVKKKTAAEIRAEELSKALRACRRAHGSRSGKRKRCEAAVHKRYAAKTKAKAKKSDERGA